MFPELSAQLGAIYFYGFALSALLCALMVLTTRHPISGAISLIGVMLSLSGLYAILDSPFIAVVQVLVYAGAIMMLLVFVIMVLNHGKDTTLPRFTPASFAVLLLPLALGATFVRIIAHGGGAANAGTVRGDVAAISEQLFATGAGSQGWYLLFEISGLLLLAAIVGAVLLAKRSLDSTEHDVNADHLGHAAAKPDQLVNPPVFPVADHDEMSVAGSAT
jgi:NADH-quinone oxidoreductase subunit J